jgi:hypothetical protein
MAYFIFLPAIESAGLPSLEFDVAETFGFSCLGFLASLLPFLPLAIFSPSKLQCSFAEMARYSLRYAPLAIQGLR